MSYLTGVRVNALKSAMVPMTPMARKTAKPPTAAPALAPTPLEEIATRRPPPSDQFYAPTIGDIVQFSG